jgi:hypothetical protein
MIDDKLVREMMRRFEGYDQAYGSYDPEAAMSDMRGGKVEIKSSAYTKRKPVTAALWLDHLLGKRPLGIIAIRDNNTCVWGCIDIDIYNIDPVELIRDIDKEKLPLIVCKTKSGGAHVFLFMAEPVAAAQMQIGLRDVAARLRHGGSEIFPKQGKVELVRGDLGTWLNMPYFGDDRQAYKPDGTFMTLEEFLIRAAELEQPANWFDQKKKKPEHDNGSFDFKDGPPCMQHLSAIGLGEGQRNTGLYAFGIYAKKKYGTNWQDQLEQWNRDFVSPPLPATELVDIIKRLGQKDYNYPCKDQPIVAHCNSAVCRTRKYGVGGTANELPVVSGLSKLGDDNPVWFLDIGTDRIELTTEQLTNYRSFQRACVVKLNVMFKGMKQSSWEEVISHLLNELNQIESSEDIGILGQFTELLDDFCNDKHRGKIKDDIVHHKPWLDDSDEDPKKHKHYFRLKDLQKYLTDANFDIYSRGQIVTRLKTLGGGDDFFNVKGKGMRVWWIPADFFTVTPKIPTAPLEGPPI